MKQRPRIYYTDTQKALMWDRWQKGESLQQIAQLFDRNLPLYNVFFLRLAVYDRLSGLDPN